MPNGLTDSIVNQSETRWPPAFLFEWQPIRVIANGITLPGDVSLYPVQRMRLLCCFEISQTSNLFKIERYFKTCDIRTPHQYVTFDILNSRVMRTFMTLYKSCPLLSTSVYWITKMYKIAFDLIIYLKKKYDMKPDPWPYLHPLIHTKCVVHPWPLCFVYLPPK